MNRAFQALLIVSTVALSWFAMMAVHELGHVLHAWATGGTIVRVVLNPLEFSRTDVDPNPRPLVVAWGGAVWGCLIPLSVLLATQMLSLRYVWLARFFAGFCLVANGAYLVGGAIIGAGDAGDLLRHGAARWQLMAFGVTTVAAGLWLWNGLGRYFGLGKAALPVDRRAAVGLATTLVALLAIGIYFCR